MRWDPWPELTEVTTFRGRRTGGGCRPESEVWERVRIPFLYLLFKIYPLSFPFPYSISEINPSTFRSRTWFWKLTRTRFRSRSYFSNITRTRPVPVPLLIFFYVSVPVSVLFWTWGLMKIVGRVAIQQIFLNPIYKLYCLQFKPQKNPLVGCKKFLIENDVRV